MPSLSLSAARLGELFPVTVEYAYLDNAYRGALSTPVADAVRDQLDVILRQGSLAMGAAYKRHDEAAAEFARFVGARPAEICLLANAGDALSRVMLGIDWRGGDEIVAPADDYPGVLRPLLDLRRSGAAVNLVPPRGDAVTADDLLAAISPRTRLVAASHVSFKHGYRLDAARLCAECRKRGVLTVLDCVQSVGALGLNLRETGCDFATFEGRKFLCALDAIGALYVRAESLEKLTPHSVGFFSVEQPFELTRLEQPLAPDARRFRLGASSQVQVAALLAALKLQSEAGLAAIERAVLDLNAEVRARAKAARIEVIGGAWAERERSAICALRAGKPDAAVRDALRMAKVVASVREGLVRVSAHFFNNPLDLERLFKALTA